MISRFAPLVREKIAWAERSQEREKGTGGGGEKIEEMNKIKVYHVKGQLLPRLRQVLAISHGDVDGDLKRTHD